jgi:hypothetical protein
MSLLTLARRFAAIAAVALPVLVAPATQAETASDLVAGVHRIDHRSHHWRHHGRHDGYWLPPGHRRHWRYHHDAYRPYGYYGPRYDYPPAYYAPPPAYYSPPPAVGFYFHGRW